MSTTVELQAGPELDVYIAQKLMGYVRVQVKAKEAKKWGTPEKQRMSLVLSPEEASMSGYYEPADGSLPDGPWHWNAVPAYSTDIAAAWLVVEKMQQDGYKVIVIGSHQGDRFQAAFDHAASSVSMRYMQESDTAPLAICRAALAALEA